MTWHTTLNHRASPDLDVRLRVTGHVHAAVVELDAVEPVVDDGLKRAVQLAQGGGHFGFTDWPTDKTFSTPSVLRYTFSHGDLG